MSMELTNPVLIVGIGGAGSKLASRANETFGSDCLLISHDQKDLENADSIKISTESIINPSIYSIRGFTLKASEQIREKISNYSSVIIMANLAGKAGSAMAPVISQICREANKNVVSFAIMPFKYEKDRIFASGVSLKRVKTNSHCTFVIDNDALLESNPDLSTNSCYEIANTAILYTLDSLKTSVIPEETNLVTTSRTHADLEISLRDSLKMLYENAPPNSIKRSMIYVLGGNNVPVGILDSISILTSGVLSEGTGVELSSSSSDESKIVMLSSVQGETRFDKYDPLGMIPQENTLDWDEPDCSIDCKLDLYQLE